MSCYVLYTLKYLKVKKNTINTLNTVFSICDIRYWYHLKLENLFPAENVVSSVVQTEVENMF